MVNNYFNPGWPSTSFSNKQEVIKVSGRNGAEMFQMAPNSSVLLLDTTAPIIWLKTTDGAGYPTITAYDIALHQEPKQVDLASLEKRLLRLEAKINEQQSESNVEYASTAAKPTIIKPTVATK